MKERSLSRILFVVFLFMVSLISGPAAARIDTGPVKNRIVNPKRILILDGSTVHNVGELQMHITNWGLIGSMPLSSMPFSESPSAQWPAGSGVEYLFVSGLWVGAIKNGIPAVSTSAYAFEFRPTDDPIDIMFRSSEGDAGGLRLPFPHADDDRDGAADEDWRDGRDNDGDGLVDEDFAAISKQMFSCWYTDYEPISMQIYPLHNPLHIKVRQESYQWDEDGYDDFVGISYWITNTGTDMLEDVYIGIFADMDAGSRTVDNYWEDDGTDYVHAPLWCTPDGAVEVDVAYGYDVDGDAGSTPGYLGLMFLDHPTDPAGITAPDRVGLTTYARFSSGMGFDDRNDPANDFERYEVMSLNTIDRGSSIPRDWSTLISVGPFANLAPGETMVVSIAFAAGAGLNGMIQNAARARLAYEGRWFDIDGDHLTGIAGRETPVHGPASGVIIDPCRPGFDDPIDVGAGETVWINADCASEAFRAEACKYGAADSMAYMTGVGGRETNAHWTVSDTVPFVPVSVRMDIKPGSCPNPLSAELFDSDFDDDDDGDDPGKKEHRRISRGASGGGLFIYSEGHGRDKHHKGGILPVALLGDANFDVNGVDVSTIRLEGISPLDKGMDFEDEAAVADGSGDCPCTEREHDGRTDLKLKFSKKDAAEAIMRTLVDPPQPGDVITLTLTGMMNDGISFEAKDCVTIVGRHEDDEDDDDDGHKKRSRSGPVLTAPYPNPFNPSTRISFYIPTSGRVRLALYDVTGRLVDVLRDGYENRGEKIFSWNGTGLANGVYFLRLEAGGSVTARRIVILK